MKENRLLNMIFSRVSLFLALFILVAVGSCVKNLDDRSRAAEEKVVVVESPFLDTVQIDDVLLQSSSLTTINSYLFSLSPNDRDTLVRFFDLETMGYVGGFGRLGNGPSEFNTVIPSGFTKYKEQLVVTDLKHVTFYDVENGSLVLSRREKIPGSFIPLNQTFVLNDTTIGGQLDQSKKEYSVFNIAEFKETSFGDFPDFEKDIPSSAKYHLYQSKFALRPSGEKLVSVYSHFPALRIFNVESEETNVYELEPKVKQAPVQVAPDNRSVKSFSLIKYFSNVKVSNDYIVAMYQEKKIVEKEKGNRVLYEYESLTDSWLYIFDWNGRARFKIQAEDWMYNYVVSDDNKVIVIHPDVSDKLFFIDLEQL